MPVFEVKRTVLVNDFWLTWLDRTIRSRFHNLGGTLDMKSQEVKDGVVTYGKHKREREREREDGVVL